MKKRLVAFLLVVGIICMSAVASAAQLPLAKIRCDQASFEVVDEGAQWTANHWNDVQNWVMSSKGWWNYTPEELFAMTSATGRPGCSF